MCFGKTVEKTIQLNSLLITKKKIFCTIQSSKVNTDAYITWKFVKEDT